MSFQCTTLVDDSHLTVSLYVIGQPPALGYLTLRLPSKKRSQVIKIEVELPKPLVDTLLVLLRAKREDTANPGVPVTGRGWRKPTEISSLLDPSCRNAGPGIAAIRNYMSKIETLIREAIAPVQDELLVPDAPFRIIERRPKVGARLAWDDIEIVTA